MPIAHVNGINLYYESYGSGFSLVLIRGLGSNADHWYCQVPDFSAHYRTIVFDNRGIGRSDKPDSPYTISLMAEDTVGLMNVLQIPRAHILGVSMGDSSLNKSPSNTPKGLMDSSYAARVAGAPMPSAIPALKTLPPLKRCMVIRLMRPQKPARTYLPKRR